MFNFVVIKKIIQVTLFIFIILCLSVCSLYAAPPDNNGNYKNLKITKDGKFKDVTFNENSNFKLKLSYKNINQFNTPGSDQIRFNHNTYIIESDNMIKDKKKQIKISKRKLKKLIEKSQGKKYP